MGGIIQIKHDAFAAWTGGVPLADWSGLADPSKDKFRQSSQLRLLTDESGQEERSKGFDDKFEKDHDLFKFQRRLLERYKLRGLDSVTYLLDPSDDTKMINILTDHTRVTYDYVKQAIVKQYEKYDFYDEANDTAARLCLLDSLGSELYEQIVDRLPDDNPTFHHTWMLLLQLLTSDSPHRFADIKKKLLAIRPQDYPGQDISAMCLDVKKHYRSLLTAGAGVFGLNDTEKIIDAFALADGDDRYRKRIVDKQTDLDTALQFIRFMSDYDASLKHLRSHNVDVESICTLAEDQYRLALSNHRWMPALHTPDAKKPPETFSRTQINALIQQIHPSTSSSNRDKSKDRCLLCGELGHWASDCPKRNNPGNNRNNCGRSNSRGRGGGRGGRSGGRGGRGGRGNRNAGRGRGRQGTGDRASRLAPWKLIAPTSGQPEQKEVNGHTFNWCSKCSPPRWTTTHSTATHTGGSGSGHTIEHSANLIESDPFAWCIDAGIHVVDVPLSPHFLDDDDPLLAISNLFDRSPPHPATVSVSPLDSRTKPLIGESTDTPNDDDEEISPLFFCAPTAPVDPLSEPAVIPPTSVPPSPISRARPSVTTVPCDPSTESSSMHPLQLWDDSPARFPTSPTAAFTPKPCDPPIAVQVTHSRHVNPSFKTRSKKKPATISPKTPPPISVARRLPDSTVRRARARTLQDCPVPYARVVPLSDCPIHPLPSSSSLFSLGWFLHLILAPLLICSAFAFVTAPPLTFFPSSFISGALFQLFVQPILTLGSLVWHFVVLLPALLSWCCGAFLCLVVCPLLETTPATLPLLRHVYTLIAASCPSHLHDHHRWSLGRSPPFHLRVWYALLFWWRSSFWCWFGCLVRGGTTTTTTPTMATVSPSHRPRTRHPTYTRPSPRIVRAKRKKKRQWQRRKQRQEQQPKLSPGSGPTASPSPRPHCRRRTFSPNTVGLSILTLVAGANNNMSAAALSHPTKLSNAMPKESTFNIIWDSGASVSVSNCEQDFLDPINRHHNESVKGVSYPINDVLGSGTVLWSIQDENGMLRSLRIPALYIPSATTRLLSTPSLLRIYQGETVSQTGNGMRLSGIDGDPQRRPIMAYANPFNGLPMSVGYHYGSVTEATQQLANTVSVIHDNNFNLSAAQKEWYRWHCRMGHMDFAKVKFLMRSGVLATSEAQRRLHTAVCKMTEAPLCAACQFGKQKQRPYKGKVSRPARDHDGALKREKLFPGQCIAVDHFVCSTLGRLFTSRGKTKESSMYKGGALFVDMATGYVDCGLQTSLNTHQTLAAKEEFEQRCRDSGVVPQSYITDGGSAFTSKAYTAKLSAFQQIYRFAGVGAHHHNGVAERAIQTIMSLARTMMLHSAIHWPERADPSLWPMAVEYAINLHNHMPNLTTGLSPHDLFTRTRWPQSKLHDFHVWGCPIYVLNKKIADGHKLPRWKPRSDRGMFMGLSLRHSSTVPLVLNLSSGAITAQFHAVFDDWFATIATAIEDLPDFTAAAWTKMFGDSVYQFVSDDNDDTDTNPVDPTDATDAATFESRRTLVETAMDKTTPITPLPVGPPVTSTPCPTPVATTPSNTPMSLPPTPCTPDTPMIPVRLDDTPPESSTTTSRPQRERASRSPSTASIPFQSPSPQKEQPSSRRQREPRRQREQVVPKSESLAETQTIRRSSRPSKAPSRLVETMDATKQSYVGVVSWSSSSPLIQVFNPTEPASSLEPSTSTTCPVQLLCLIEMFRHYGLIDVSILKAAVSDPDTLSFDEILSDPDFDNWKMSADVEIFALIRKDVWDEVHISDAKTKILPATWVFCRKRSPTGEIKKYKARWCVRGDLQEGIFETFSPVVSWCTIRVVLIFAITHNWVLLCIDFTNVFVQATLEEPIWVHLPRGYRSTMGKDTCLRLKKSLYGTAQAPRLWYEHLVKFLLKDGFEKSKEDECLFLKKDMILFLYVDDCGVAAPNKELIDAFVQRLKDAGFELTQEGDFSEYLGIKFERDNSNNTIKMTQPGLIDKIIKSTGMEECNPNRVPCTQVGLGSDPDGSPMKEQWQYSSIVGMLLYLSTNSRPDIAFAVSQVARFSSAPKQSHAAAVKMIIRYLAGTKHQGTIFTPNTTFKLDCYVDADFAGLHGREHQDNPVSSKSRTGYVIFFCGCPLVWKSQLQTETALSTFHAEYVALSIALRQVLTTQRILETMVKFITFPSSTPRIHAEAFEDNNSALLLANNQRLTDRSKFLNTKWHHFWEAVNEKRITVSRIESANQRADYLTKGLVVEKFEHNRKLNQGW